jgi:DNA-binding PadR family transcriptional regulator
MFGRRFPFYFDSEREEGWEERRDWRRGRGRGHHGHFDAGAQEEEEGWQPEHGHEWGHHRHGPGFFGGHMRRRFFSPRGPRGPKGPRGPFGPGGPFGDEGFPGGPGRGPRFFGRGDLKYALLELLQERPMHGYEMMKALQERSEGMYSASPGSVYPTLQMLEDRDFVTVTEVEGKKVYTITDAGRAFLAEGQQEQRGGPWQGFRRGPEGDWADFAALGHELRELGPLFRHALHAARHDPEKLGRLRTLLAQVRAELATIAGLSSQE